MNLSTRRHPLTALAMALVMLVTSLPLGTAYAGMVSTKTIIEQGKPAAAETDEAQNSGERIRDVLARDDIRDQMIALGIAPAEAEARIAALTESERAAIAGRLDHLPAGEGVGSILVVLFIVFGVAVIVDALGMMNIFPFVCSGNECGAAARAYYIEPSAAPAAAGDTYGYSYEQSGRSAYQRPERQPFSETYDYDRRSSQRSGYVYDGDQYYEQPQQAPARNYYEERFGTQRYVR